MKAAMHSNARSKMVIAQRIAICGIIFSQLQYFACTRAIAESTGIVSSDSSASNSHKEESHEKKQEKKEEKKLKSEEKKYDKGDEKVRADAPCTSWVKFGVPVRSVLLCVHGLGLNSSSWEPFGKAMSQRGVATYAIDVRGFGSWKHAEGHEKVDFKKCIEDVKDTLEWLRKANPNKPLFLMGESMGGAIALHVAAQFPDDLDAVISVSSSGERFKQKRTDLKVFLHALMGPNRKFDIGSQIVDQAAQKNNALKKEWEGDPDDVMKLSPLELLQFQHFMNENHDEAKKITKLPVLMVQGSNDKLVKPEGTEELFDELKTPEKKLIMVEDGQHLIFEDKQFSQSTLNDVADWIASHSPAIEDSPLDIGMEKARADFESKQFAKAAADLKAVLLIAPKDANVHLLMGKTQFHLGHYLLARQHLMNAIRLDGRGTLIAQEANSTLLSLPQQITGARRNLPPALRGAKAKRIQQQPTVLVFNAKWSRPGKDMDTVVAQAKARYGNRVVFKNIDVDDPANSELVSQYDIGPVPTTVFLDTNGAEASIQVGYAGLDGMLKGLQKIILTH